MPPAEVNQPKKYWTPVTPKCYVEISARSTFQNWNFGPQFRLESLLCRRLKEAECSAFADDQKCKIDFEICDGTKIQNMKIATPSKDPKFDQLSKDILWAAIDSPELKLDKKRDGKPLAVSSTFYKAGTWRWVVVHFNDDNKPVTTTSQNSYGFKLNKDSRYAEFLEFRKRHLLDQKRPVLQVPERKAPEQVAPKLQAPEQQTPEQQAPEQQAPEPRVPAQHTSPGPAPRQMIEYKNEFGEKRFKWVPVQ